MQKMDNDAKIEKINAEIARMEVESELLYEKDHGGGVDLGGSYLQSFSNLKSVWQIKASS
jgi:hypothetical protein